MILRTKPDTASKRLTGQIHQMGDASVMSAPGLLLFGLPFVGIGVFMSLLGFGLLDIRNAPRGQEALMMKFIAPIFALGGFMVWGMGFRSWSAARAKEKRRARHPFSPALQDHAWNPQGQRFSSWKRPRNTAAGLAVATLFLIPFHILVRTENAPLFVAVILALFDLLLLLGWMHAVYLAMRALKFRGGRLAYSRFPLPVKGSFEVVWSPDRPMREVGQAQAALRGVREFWETRRSSGGKSSKQLVHEQVFALEMELDPVFFNNARSITLPFELPGDLPATNLSGGSTFFWKLEIELEVPGVNLHEEYLLPVYDGA